MNRKIIIEIESDGRALVYPEGGILFSTGARVHLTESRLVVKVSPAIAEHLSRGAGIEVVADREYALARAVMAAAQAGHAGIRSSVETTLRDAGLIP